MNLPIIFPMKAVHVKPEKLQQLWKDKNYICEQKFDGSRYLVRKENGEVRIVSRQPSKADGKPVDKTELVPHLVETFRHLPDGTILDGEIITHEFCESHEVTSIMGSLPERAIRLQKERGFVKYVLYDVIFFNGKDVSDVSYYNRRLALENIYKEYLSASPYIMLTKIYHKDKESVYYSIIEKGGEGVVLKNIKSRYEYSLDGAKPKAPKDTWVKVKKYKTYDVVIMGFTKPTMEYTGKEIETWQYWYSPELNEYVLKENYSADAMKRDGFIPVTKPFWNNWIGAIRFGQYKGGELVEIGQTSGIDDETKHRISQNPSAFIGKVIEVGAMRQNKSTGALVHPRFIRFREDKNPEQCILFND